MDRRYLDFCTADRYFYDTPARESDAEGFAIASRPLPGGWQRNAAGGWLVYARDDARLPVQGWKIHASATPGNAAEILGVLWDYCVPRGIVFKHLLGPRVLVANNSKHADRGSSAKLATLYPRDEEHFELVLRELAPLLHAQQGPYILSDLRWGGGPLYVRYGGFAKRMAVFDRGEAEPAIETPDGRLVPDRREPAFRVPEWVTLPSFLEPHLAARNAVTLTGLPYRVERALHFSNGGGVYAATHTGTGESVVLKEARPFAGLDGLGADAVSRLERERKMLTHLEDLKTVPCVRDHFVLGEHHFLVEQLMPGLPLGKEFARRYPYDGAGLAEYAQWATGIVDDVEGNVEALREAGVVFGDLHLNNIIVGPDGRTSLIDFEVAAFVGEGRRAPLGHPAFRAPPDRSGFDIDRYALACLRFALFFPLTTLFALDGGKAAELAAEIQRLFPLPAGYLDEAVTTITGGRPSPIPRRRVGQRLVTRRPVPRRPVVGAGSMVRAILASATPGRDDRLFPGDIEQFGTGGANFAYGAAGVLWALSVTGAGSFPGHEEWLLDHVDERPGFFAGCDGIAYALEQLGHRDRALALLDLGPRPEVLDLFSGLAGVGLNLLHFAGITGDTGLRDAAIEVAEAVVPKLGRAADHPHAGLLRGWSGPALMFIRLFESTGDGGHLDLAAAALDEDLRRCVVQTDGSLQVDEGYRTMPYLATGSVGIGLVLREFLRHRPSERYARALDQIDLAAKSGFYAQSGLFNGRAGITLFHRGTAEFDRQARRLDWHKVDHRGEVAFPGDQLYRLSMDLGTGSAGVLLALSGKTLPFLTSDAYAKGVI